MATFRILYWQEIPSQIVAADDDGEVSLPMPQKFQDRIDQVALERGLGSGDDYLAQWNWGDDSGRTGSAQDVAAAVIAELDSKASW